MGVEFQRKEYIANLPRWTLVNDCYQGEPAIKAKTDVYLPYFGPRTPAQDALDDPKRRYDNYLQRAKFYNFVKDTVDGMKGLGFSGGTKFETSSPNMAYLESDLDGKGVSIDQSAKATTEEVLKTARAGLLVDYPPTQGATTVAVAQAGNIRAKTVRYNAAAITNWGVEVVGGKTRLALVVLRETVTPDEEQDEFERTEELGYRVLILVDGLYEVRIYDKEGNLLPGRTQQPTMGSGARLDFIPFQFVGAQDNDVDVDSAPVFDIASVNIGHYVNSADYENSAWLCGQPQPWISGLTKTWADKYFKDGVQLGSGAVLPLPEGAAFGIEQTQPNAQAFEAMGHKEKHMVRLGARAVTSDQPSARSATEASIENTNNTSVLFDVMANVQAAYNQALMWCAMFNRENEDSTTYGINYEAVLSQISPEAARLIVEAWQGGLVAKEDARAALRTARYITRSDEEIDGDIASETDPIDLDDDENDAAGGAA